jgi:beta-glucosidase
MQPKGWNHLHGYRRLEAIEMTNFPRDFIWGVAAAAYQIEGAADEDGRGLSIWDTFCETPGKVVNGDTGAVACDHYHLYPQDIAMMKGMGIKHYRLSISWSRLFPNGDEVREERGFQFYDKLINALLTAGISPLVTLYHWDLPQALEEKGGWQNREILKAFEFYAREVAKHFGDRVKNFSPINEPWCVAWLGYGIGVHAPGISNRASAFAAAHHTVLAHGIALKAMREVHNDLKLGPVLNQDNHPADDMNDSVLTHAHAVLDAQQNRWWMEAFFKGEYPEILLEKYGDEILPLIHPGDMELAQQKNDFIGINFYFDSRIGKKVAGRDAYYDISSMMGLDVDRSFEGELTDMGWPITPDGIRNLLVRWKRVLGDSCPDLYITENGCASPDGIGPDGEIHDQRRISYLNSYIAKVGEAIAEGAPVKGYYHWSLMDNFEWSFGYEKRFGIVYVDYATQKRTLKDSAKWYLKVIESNGGTINLN